MSVESVCRRLRTGNTVSMDGSRSIRRRVRKRAGGVDFAADVNAQISVNTGSSGQTSVARSTQSTAISQTRHDGKEEENDESATP